MARWDMISVARFLVESALNTLSFKRMNFLDYYPLLTTNATEVLHSMRSVCVEYPEPKILEVPRRRS
jgi:hypothetical protein